MARTARVTHAEVAAMTPKQRCAWGAICAEAVTNMYSPHFQVRFDTGTAYDLVWRFVESGELDKKAAQRFVRKCSRLGAKEEARDYGLPNGMLAGLVAELLDRRGHAVVECVGFCARMYPQILFFRHGIDDRVPGFNPRHLRTLMDEYNGFSRSVFAFVLKTTSLRREKVPARFVFDPASFELPRRVFRSKSPADRGRVPEHEIVR